MANQQTQGTFVNAGVFFEEGEPYFIHNDLNLRSKVNHYNKTGTVLIQTIDNNNNNVIVGSKVMPSVSVDSQNPEFVIGSVNGYLSREIMNVGTGGSVSADYVAYAGTSVPGNIGTYVDMGITSHSFNDATQGLLDADAGYIFSASSNMYVIAGTTGTLGFATNGWDSKSKLRATIDPSGNIVLGTGAVGSASATGFTYIPGGTGAPTGTPTAKTGMVPMYYDVAANNFYFYNGAWRKSATGGTYA